MCVQMCGIVHAQILYARGHEICLLQMPIGQAKVYYVCPSEMYSVVCIHRPYVLCTTGTIPWCRQPTCMYICCKELGYISLFSTGCCKVWIRFLCTYMYKTCVLYTCVRMCTHTIEQEHFQNVLIFSMHGPLVETCLVCPQLLTMVRLNLKKGEESFCSLSIRLASTMPSKRT